MMMRGINHQNYILYAYCLMSNHIHLLTVVLDSAITKKALMALTAPKINCVDFCHDSAITKKALMALAAPKIENLGNFGRIVLKTEKSLLHIEKFLYFCKKI